ncbi:MAG: GAF domain-containing protein [Cyanobacteria bacterium QH_8_48_120]|nr:MAG: GAF domain-containing protein [Cyanobacteria bacterium QH_8_48_120]
MNYQGVIYHRWQSSGVRVKAITLAAIAASTLLVLADRTRANPYTEQPIIQQTTQAEQASANETANTEAESQGQSSLILWIEIGVAASLLAGLVAAFLAYRAASQVQTIPENQESDDGKLNGFMGILNQDVFSKNQQEASKQLEASDHPQLTAIGEDQQLNQGKPEKPPHSPSSQAQLVTSPTSMSQEQEEEEEAERSQLQTEISQRMRQSLDLEELLKTAVKEVRRALKTDRVIIYGLDSASWEGTVVAESVAPNYPKTLNIKIDDPCFRDRHVEMYENGRIRAIDNIYQEPDLTDCHIRTLEQFAVKANLTAPILKNNQLLGLLIAHHCCQPRNWQQSEVELFQQLATQVGFAVDQVSFQQQQEAEAERSQLIRDVSHRIRQSLNLEDLLKITVKEVRRILKTDRAIIYGLDPDNWKGVVVAESVAPGLPQTQMVKIDDPCFRDRHVEMYKKGRVRAIDNIHQEPGLTDCHIRTLEQFAVKANLVAPIVKNNQLLGLLIAHQCSEPRNWEQHEIDLFAQLATQVGLAVDQVNLIEPM